MVDEILDIVDPDDKVIGKAPRSEVHQNPNLIHRVVHCWIFNNEGQILWQQRSLKKAQAPGLWDMSCGGHVLTGNKPEETLARELHEELGLKNIKTQFVKKYIQAYNTQTELIYLYYAIVNQQVEQFILQKKEVEKVEWVDFGEAMIMVINKQRESTDFLFSQVPIILIEIFKNAISNISMDNSI